MNLRKYRWSRAYESAEEELIQLLAAKQIPAERWVGEPGEQFDSHIHPYDKRLWCAEGSIVLNVDGSAITLQSGDALDLPAQTAHDALVGFSGCAMYESHHKPDMSNGPASDSLSDPTTSSKPQA